MPYTVTLQPSGHRFTCDPDVSILKSGLAAGMFMPYNCRSGVCQTCRGQVLEGTIDFGQVHPAYLTEADKAQGFALLCQAQPRSDVTIEVQELSGSAIPPKVMPVRVLKADKVAPDVMVLQLGVPANEPVHFRAGQYLEIDCGDGERRSYSMANVSNSEGVRQLELHVRHIPGGLFTDRLFTRLKPRELLRIEMPLGSFYLREDSAKPMIMLASGTGFAPIKSIVEYTLQQGSTRPITIYWGGRRKTDLYMAALADQWAAEHAHIRFVPVLSEATDECAWTGRTGFVHATVMQDFPDLSGHQVYACGAPIMIDSARREFSARCALPSEEFYADSFTTAADRAQLAPATQVAVAAD